MVAVDARRTDPGDAESGGLMLLVTVRLWARAQSATYHVEGVPDRARHTAPDDQDRPPQAR